MSDETLLPVTNIIDDIPIDRIYMNVSGVLQLVLKDGSIYKSKIDKRSIKLKDGTMAHVYHADGKYFDRSGMPISKPDNLITREKHVE